MEMEKSYPQISQRTQIKNGNQPAKRLLPNLRHLRNLWILLFFPFFALFAPSR
jgi:hypothetical protein